MSGIVRIAAVGTVLAASAVLVVGATASASDRGNRPGDKRHGNETTLHFDVNTSPSSYTDLGKPGPSAADVIVFNDTLLHNRRTVGHEVGSCVVVDPSGVANCTGVATVDGRGTIAFAFENGPPARKILAITGGSGAYRTARGDGVLVESGHETATLDVSIVLD